MIDVVLMGFKEWLATKLQNTEIFEMADSRADAERIVRGLGDEIVLHLVKVMYWVDDTNKDKHITDIETWLSRIDSILLKPKSRPLKQKDAYLWLWAGPFGNGYEWFEKKVVKNRLRDYHNLPKNGISSEELYLALEDIFKKISKDISEQTYFSIREYL